jgi:hypothetical protein
MHQDLSNLADWQQLKQFRLGNLVNMISERINEIVMNVTQVAAARLKTNKVYQIQKKKSQKCMNHQCTQTKASRAAVTS